MSLIFEVDGDIQKIAGDLSCCYEVNMLVLKKKNPRPPALNDSPACFTAPYGIT